MVQPADNLVALFVLIAAFILVSVTNAKSPPRWLVILADVSNIVAGVILCVAFFLVCSCITFHTMELQSAGPWINRTFLWEGVFWAVAAACLAKVNIITSNAGGAVGQTIICFGGLFFTISGLGGNPANVISLKYVIPQCETLTKEGTCIFQPVSFADACPYYGITCFMVATSMGLLSVMSLPKKIVSPFGGVACFFIGAWLIGVFGFWGPTLFGGAEDFSHFNTTGHAGSMFEMPTYSFTWVHVVQLIGAVFLTIGGIIFGMLDKIFGGAAPEGEQDLLEDSEGSEELTS